jgi:hypothetical protein
MPNYDNIVLKCKEITWSKLAPGHLLSQATNEHANLTVSWRQLVGNLNHRKNAIFIKKNRKERPLRL